MTAEIVIVTGSPPAPSASTNVPVRIGLLRKGLPERTRFVSMSWTSVAIRK
jgi:hypothetical protein